MRYSLPNPEEDRPTATITPDEWLQFLRTEYLDSFIHAGGTSIKFAVPLQEELRKPLADSIANLGQDAGYTVANVSSDETRVHMIDQVFFKIAAQIPWRQLSQNVITTLAEKADYRPPVEDNGLPILDRLAKANDLEPGFIRLEARRWIERSVTKWRSLAKDFRVAASFLCLAELSGGEDGDSTIQAIVEWLTGRNPAISAVKPYQIFSRINRSNARHLLESLLLWVQFAGYTGTLVILDISRITITRNPHDSHLFYTKSAMYDTYEVLRQFIDATDRMKGCLIIVIPSRDFLDLESSGRGLGAYDALKFRVYDEVRDQRLVNPMAALIRLSPQHNST